MRVSLQFVKTAEIHEGLIRTSDDFPILNYIHCRGGRGDRNVERAPVIVECLVLLCSQSHSSAIKDVGPRYAVMSNQR
jgi:hypothetical protein